MSTKSPAKQNILRRIEKGLQKSLPTPFPDITNHTPTLLQSKESTDIEFAEKFTQNGGAFIYCPTKDDFLNKLQKLSKQQDWQFIHCWNQSLFDYFHEAQFRKIKIGHRLDRADAGITFCETLIAQSGSILISAGAPSGRMLPMYPPVWIVIAFAGQIVDNLNEGIQILKNKYDGNLPTMISQISSPARSKAIEMSKQNIGLGPNQVFLFFIDETSL